MGAELHTITTDLQKIRVLLERYDAPHPVWVSLKQAASMKGVSLNTIRSMPHLQPCGGIKWKKVNGVKSWNYDDVVEWLAISDDLLCEYLDAQGARVSEAIREKYQSDERQGPR